MFSTAQNSVGFFGSPDILRVNPAPEVPMLAGLICFSGLERESAWVVHQHFSHHTNRLARTLAPPTCSTVSNSFRCALFVGASHFIGRSNSRNRRVPTGRLKLIAAVIRPSLRDSLPHDPVPALKTPGYFRLSLSGQRPYSPPCKKLRCARCSFRAVRCVDTRMRLVYFFQQLSV
jgi:hypothetical protein